MSRITVYADSLTVSENAGVTPMHIKAPTDNRYSQSRLTIAVRSLPTDGAVYLSDGVTPVFVGEHLSSSQLAGLEFKPSQVSADATSFFTYRVTDPGGVRATGSVTLNVTDSGTPPPPPPPPPPGGNDVLDTRTGQHYATIAAGVAAAASGDTLQVAAGTYTNDFAQISKNLTLVGVGGMVNVVGTTQIPNGKGLFVTNGNISIDHFSFSGAAVDPSDANGAGIRYESGNLTLTNDYFFSNENGLLAAANGPGSITIKNSEFYNNGVADSNSAGYGFTHNLYVGDIAQLTIANSYFHAANIGHEIKSRAENTTITNSRIQDEGGTASFGIDLPNGGNAIIQNNVIEKGPHADNSVMITSGEEGGVHANSALLVSGNTFINDYGSGALAVRNNTSATAQISNNSFFGMTQAQIASGPNSQSGNTFLSSEPALITTHPWA